MEPSESATSKFVSKSGPSGGGPIGNVSEYQVVSSDDDSYFDPGQLDKPREARRSITGASKNAPRQNSLKPEGSYLKALTGQG